MSIEACASLLEKENISLERGARVARLSTFRIGGEVALAVYPKSRGELLRVLRCVCESDVRYEIIGNASNVLFAFEHFDGVFIFTRGARECKTDGERIYADAGVSLTYLANLAAKNALSGVEFAFGIPGLVGGSVYMNAGAHGADMSDIVLYSEAFDMENGDLLELREHSFDYRRSIYMEKRGLVCLGACFKLCRGNIEDIELKMRENAEKRRASQPLEYPNVGSYFKRPPNNFAGKLIDEAGLKGLSVGGAQVSKKHAGFIINTGGATYRDVLELEEKVKREVLLRFGVELCREVRIITN